MTTISTIFLFVLIIIVVIIAILFLVLILPFKYSFNLKYIENNRIYLKFSYIVFLIEGYLVFDPEIDYSLKLWNKSIIKKSNGDNLDDDNGIDKTDFIENKDLKKDISSSKKSIKDLFISAKKYEKSIISNNNNLDNIELNENSSINVINEKKVVLTYIDRLKNILPNDQIYVIKIIIDEIMNALCIFKVDKFKVSINYSFDKPYHKGIIMSIAAPIYSIIGDDINLEFDDKKETIYSINITGHPILIRLLGPIYRLLKDKEFRRIVFKKK